MAGARISRTIKALWRYPVLKRTLENNQNSAVAGVLMFALALLAMELESKWMPKNSLVFTMWAASAYAAYAGLRLMMSRRAVVENILQIAAQSTPEGNKLFLFWLMPMTVALSLVFLSGGGSLKWLKQGWARLERSSGVGGGAPKGLAWQLGQVAEVIGLLQLVMMEFAGAVLAGLGPWLCLALALFGKFDYQGPQELVMLFAVPMALVLSGVARDISRGCGFAEVKLAGKESWKVDWSYPAKTLDKVSLGGAWSAMKSLARRTESELLDMAEKTGVLSKIEQDEMSSELRDGVPSKPKRL